MPVEGDLQFITHFLVKHTIFLQRFHVQIQFIAIVGAIGCAWLISRGLRSHLSRLFPHVLEQEIGRGHKFSGWQFSIAALYYLLIPALSLLMLALMSQLLLLQHLRIGLLQTAMNLLWIYLTYRFLLFFLYALFPRKVVRKYHLRLFAPTFVLYTFGRILSLSSNLAQLAQVVPVPLFGSPFTLGHLFVLTVGLYFWIVVDIFLESFFVWILSYGSPRNGSRPGCMQRDWERRPVVRQMLW